MPLSTSRKRMNMTWISPTSLRALSRYSECRLIFFSDFAFEGCPYYGFDFGRGLRTFFLLFSSAFRGCFVLLQSSLRHVSFPFTLISMFGEGFCIRDVPSRPGGVEGRLHLSEWWPFDLSRRVTWGRHWHRAWVTIYRGSHLYSGGYILSSFSLLSSPCGYMRVCLLATDCWSSYSAIPWWLSRRGHSCSGI